MTAPTYESALREQYDLAAAEREQYRRPPRRRVAHTLAPIAQAATVKPRPYRVTDDARVRCECGVLVYTESRDGGPAVLPATCWRCRQPLRRP